MDEVWRQLKLNLSIIHSSETEFRKERGSILAKK
jgi:hypothetical protein